MKKIKAKEDPKTALKPKETTKAENVLNE